MSDDTPFAPLGDFLEVVDVAPAWKDDAEEATVKSLIGSLEPDTKGQDAHQAALQEQLNAGYDEGLRRAKAQVLQIVERYHQALTEIELLRERIMLDSEEALVDLGLHLARLVIGNDHEGRRRFLQDMVAHATQMLLEADNIILRVSKADYASLKAKHRELIGEHTSVSIVEDDELELGGLIAESAIGRIDASIETRLTEMAAEVRRREFALMSDEGPKDGKA